MDLTSVISALKLPPRILAAIVVVGGLLLFLPKNALETLKLESVASNFGAYIGFTFLTASVLLSISLSTKVSEWVKSRWKRYKRRALAFSSLKSLDHQEKAVLREFFIQGQNTIQLPISHTVVTGLLEKGVLCRVETLLERSIVGILSPVQITDELRDLVTLDLLEIPSSFETEPTDSDLEYLRTNRPDFILDIEEHKNTFHTSWTRHRIPF